MSYAEPVQPSPPGAPPARPTVVTVSTWLLWLAALLYLISAVANLANIGVFSEVYQEAYAGTDAEGTEGFAVGSVVVGVVLSLLFAVGFAVLGVFNNRGKNPSRITTWVLGGVALCCAGLSLVLTGLLGGMEVEGGPDPAEIQRMLDAELPAWYGAATFGGTIGTILLLLVALILLALPASNEFFRKPPEVFEPPPSYPSPPSPPPAGS